MTLVCAVVACVVFAEAQTGLPRADAPRPVAGLGTHSTALGPIGRFLTPADTFSRRRFYASAAAATAIYGTAATLLYKAWYEDYELGGFRTIDDSGEWLGMDKVGHVYGAYHYARWAHTGAKWTGMRDAPALLAATGVSLLLQSTVEVMDGHSAAWGFSWHDMAANSLGTGFFVGQQLAFGEQRVQFKMSSWREDYGAASVPATRDGAPASTLERGAEIHYGATRYERFFKDYNAQKLWLGANPNVLLGRPAKLPWLNLAVGYSADNVFGPYGNVWDDRGNRYRADAIAPRNREFMLSLDVDLTRIPTRSPVLKTLFAMFNNLKVPAPALIYGGEDGLSWSWLYY